MKANSPLAKAIAAFALTLCLLLVLWLLDIDPLFPLIRPWWALSVEDSSLFHGIAALLLSLLVGFLVWLLATIRDLRFTLSTLKARLAVLENADHKE